MKKFLSLVLIVLMFPFAMFLSACGEGGGYNLDNLSEDFYSITSDAEDNIIKKGNKIQFSYSHHVHNGEHYLNNAIDNNSLTYSNIKRYNEVFDNLMLFSYTYVDECSNNDVGVDKDTKNNIENAMNELHTAIKDIDNCTNLFSELLKITPDEEKGSNINCLQRFEYLIVSYETLLQKATIFSNELEKVYFNNVLTNSNPNFSKIGLGEFDAIDVAVNLDARLNWQISNLTKVYVEIYVCNDNLSTNIKNGQTLDLYKNGYKDKISEINKTISSTKVAEIANNIENKTKFYNLAVKAYNAQVIINNEQDNFISACKNINYVDVINNQSTASSEQKINKLIIESFNTILSEYNEILVDMVTMVNV